MKQPAEEQPPGSPGPPLTRLNVGLRALGTATAKLALDTKELEQCQQELRGLLSRAWQDREEQVARYYGLLRGLLAVLDSCQASGEGCPEALTVQFTGLLQEHGVVAMMTQIGDTFDPARHECVRGVAAEGSAAGVIVAVLQTGYIQEQAKGETLVIRPAKVHVAQV